MKSMPRDLMCDDCVHCTCTPWPRCGWSCAREDDIHKVWDGQGACPLFESDIVGADWFAETRRMLNIREVKE